MEKPDFYPFWSGVKADVYRVIGHFSLLRLLGLILFSRTFRPVFTLRACQAASNIGFAPLRALLFAPLRAWHGLACKSAGIELVWWTYVGAGFRIVYGYGMVITPYAKIGSNVTFFHGVTLMGQSDITLHNRRVKFPVIEDEVWVGAHAVISGGVIIGEGSRVAPGAIVSQNVPPHTIVGGNPAKVLKEGVLPDVYNPAPGASSGPLTPPAPMEQVFAPPPTAEKELPDTAPIEEEYPTESVEHAPEPPQVQEPTPTPSPRRAAPKPLAEGD
jgi:serine O-acetyltransferase